MAQAHFLLTAAARTISLREAMELTEEDARLWLAELRWESRTHQACPHCGAIDAHRYVPLQKRWRCRHCYMGFSVTSGTKFNANKLPLRLLVAAFILYVNSVKGLSALQLARELNIQHKTAYVLLHKIRESILQSVGDEPLTGTVEVDACHVLDYVRPKNRKKDRVDRRLAEHQRKDKCVVLALRERHDTPKAGAKRTRTFVLPAEEAAHVLPVIQACVAPGAQLVTDEASAYTLAGARFEHSVVSHSDEYRAKDGTNQNQAESYFARVRRFFMGQIHRSSRRYLDAYVGEMAWREDHRRISNGEQFKTLLTACLRLPPSRDWAGYWQGNHRLTDALGA